MIVGSGQVGTQPTAAVAELPPNVQLDGVVGTGPASSNGTGTPSNGSGGGSSGQGGSGDNNSKGNGALSTQPDSFAAIAVALFAFVAALL